MSDTCVNCGANIYIAHVRMGGSSTNTAIPRPSAPTRNLNH